jgi:zinc D-Ala-D-Ala carboxypeptidase
MQLTQHFTLAELTRSDTATRLGIDNVPPPEIVPRLVLLAELLERIRATLNCPVIVTSGYRCEQLNAAIGGVTSSDHSRGHAADIAAPAFGTPSQVATLLAPLVSTLGIGQLILEGFRRPGGRRSEWVHVSTRAPEKAVNRVLTITDAGVQAGIQALA